MGTSADDLAILLNECIQQREEFRELNAELLAALKKLDSVSPPMTCVKAAIAKAEKLRS